MRRRERPRPDAATRRILALRAQLVAAEREVERWSTARPGAHGGRSPSMPPWPSAADHYRRRALWLRGQLDEALDA